MVKMLVVLIAILILIAIPIEYYKVSTKQSRLASTTGPEAPAVSTLPVYRYTPSRPPCLLQGHSCNVYLQPATPCAPRELCDANSFGEMDVVIHAPPRQLQPRCLFTKPLMRPAVPNLVGDGNHGDGIDRVINGRAPRKVLIRCKSGISL